jgi:hypothetical protein
MVGPTAPKASEQSQRPSAFHCCQYRKAFEGNLTPFGLRLSKIVTDSPVKWPSHFQL